jgi:hypothetical protein
MDFVTIHTTFSSAEAQLVGSRLEAASFHPNIANEYSAANLGGMSQSTLIRVEVPEAEAVEAKEFLAAGNVTEE